MRRWISKRTSQLGVTLWELALVVAVIGAIAVGAVSVGSSWRATAGALADISRLESRIEHLKHTVMTWYRGTYCRAEMQDRSKLGFPPEFPLRDIDARGRGYPLTGEPATGEGADVREGGLRWEISWPPSALPRNPVGSSCLERLTAKRQYNAPLRLRVFWSPPETWEQYQPTSILARRLNVWCDDDNNARTAEPCDGLPADERLVWSSSLRDRIDRDHERTRRYIDWIREHGLNCDADGLDCDDDGQGEGDGVLDERCDSDLDGNFDGAPRFDANGDGQLDLDVNGDFVVDRADWHLLGC